MYETDDDLRKLQRILDESYVHAGEHLRSIFTPERRMSARDIARTLSGVFVLHLATVTCSAEPFVAPIDGLFFRGKLWFSVPPGAVRVRHLRSRPRVSAAYTRGEDLCVIVHGEAHEIDTHDPQHADFMEYCREVYGPAWDAAAERYSRRRGAGFTAWIEPRRLFASAMRPQAIA